MAIESTGATNAPPADGLGARSAGRNGPAQASAAARPRTFPGGRARLPRLQWTEPEGEPEIEFVNSAFLRAHELVDNEPLTATFADYFTAESLYDDVDEVPDTPRAVLGVADHASWTEIVAAHRRLMKAVHPDRLESADRETRNAAERRAAEINAALTELRREFNR